MIARTHNPIHVLTGKGLWGLGTVSHRLSEVKTRKEGYARITSHRRKWIMHVIIHWR